MDDEEEKRAYSEWYEGLIRRQDRVYFWSKVVFAAAALNLVAALLINVAIWAN